MRIPAVATLACICFLAGCAVSLMPPTAQTNDRPEAVLLRAEDVFRAYNIPVEEVDRALFRVRSDTFLVRQVWPPDDIQSRVHCGVGAVGTPISRDAEIELQMEASASASRRERNSRRTYTRVRLESSGEVVGIGGGDDPDVMGEPCRLSREFAQEMLDRIAGTPMEPWSGR